MVVVDNNVLSSLAKVQRLDLLDGLFESVATVPSVLDELHRDEIAGCEFVDRIDAVKEYRGGWLAVLELTTEEVELADTIVDDSLSFTDASCIAVAESRDRRLVTDDGHVGEMAVQRGVSVWDLKLLLEAGVETDLIETETALGRLVSDLETEDGYRFADEDPQDLFDRF